MSREAVLRPLPFRGAACYSTAMEVYWLVILVAVIILGVLLRLSTARSRGSKNVGVRIDFDGYKGRELNERYVKQDHR